MKDQSILNSANKKDESYLDDLAFAVCVNGESLEKYKKIVEKKYGTDVYSNMVQFANTLHQQVARRQFTNTSLLSLKFSGKNAGLSEMAIDMILEHFNSKIKEEQLKKEEDEYWNNCSHKDKSALQEYLRKYPKGQYVKEAQAKIADINKEEKAKREDTAFWEQCNPNDKHQLKEYLRKYPSGLFAARAVSLIADLERIEKKAIEESRVFNQCRTQRDYMNYLSQYPNGAYSAKAKAIIEDLGRKEIEENRVYNLCKDKNDYLGYLRKYPNGKYVKEAQEKIKVLENAENNMAKETAFWSQCSPNSIPQLQEYIRKYPNGMYATRAKSFVANLERIEKEAKRIRIEEERRRKETVVWNALKSCSREDVEKYGISIFSFSPGKELTIYYRGYTFVCQEEITMIRNYLDIKSLLKLITEKGGRGIFEVKDYLRKDLETYYQENSNTLANAENIITFCSESDYLRLLSNKRYYNVRRIAQEMQLLPLSFDLHKDSAYSIEYQDLFCDADIGNGLCEILQAGFIGDHRENLKDLIDSDQKLIHKKFSSFEGFTHLVLGAIVQYKILTKKYEEDSVLLAYFPFDVNAEIWVNGRCRDYLRLIKRCQEIPFKASKTIIDDDCSSIILTFLGKRFVFDVPKMFGRIPKSFEITFDVNAEFHIIFILKDKETNKVIFIRQEEFLKYEEIPT